MPTIRPDTGAPRGFGPLAQHGQARTVSDAEILDHIEHCRSLMEARYARFERLRDPQDRADAVEWARRRDEAMAALSPECKAAREADVQRAIDGGVGYFAAQGDAARVALQRCAA